MPQPPNAWPDLSAGFAEIDRELAPPSLLSRIGSVFGLLRMPRYAVPFAAGVLGAAVFMARTRVDLELAERTEAAAVVLPEGTAPGPVESREHETRSVETPVASPAEEPAMPASAEELMHSSVLVAQLLHQRGADLGEPIEISRGADRVVVRGVGLDLERAHELEPLLKQIPHVEFQLSAAGAAGAVTTVGRFAPNGEAPFGKELARELGGQAALDALAADALDQAETLMTRAHALRRLAEQFSNGPFSAEDLQVIRSLRSEHAKAMAAELARLERELAPVIRALGATAGPLPTTTPNEGNLLGSAWRLESSIAELMGAKAISGAADQLPARLATDLASVSALAKSFAARN
jgi:hypothetical protein